MVRQFVIENTKILQKGDGLFKTKEGNKQVGDIAWDSPKIFDSEQYSISNPEDLHVYRKIQCMKRMTPAGVTYGVPTFYSINM